MREGGKVPSLLFSKGGNLLFTYGGFLMQKGGIGGVKKAVKLPLLRPQS